MQRCVNERRCAVQYRRVVMYSAYAGSLPPRQTDQADPLPAIPLLLARFVVFHCRAVKVFLQHLEESPVGLGVSTRASARRELAEDGGAWRLTFLRFFQQNRISKPFPAGARSHSV